MAAFQSIQKHPIILSAILGGGLILMIIMFGFDDYSGFRQASDTVLSVNDQSVSYPEYETERQRQADFLQSFQGADINKAEISHQINEQVYSQFVQNLVLDNELDKVGIGVCSAELTELVEGAHISPVLTQIFGQGAQMYGKTFADRVRSNDFEEFAQQYNAPFITYNNWMVLEEQIKNNRKAEKFNALLSAALAPNKLEAMDIYNGENTDVTFTYVSKRVASVADTLVNVSNSDIKAYYENHKEDFKQPRQTREISYIAVALRPSDNDRADVLANLQSQMTEFTEGDVKEVIANGSSIPFIDAYVNNETFRGDLKEFVDNNEAGAVSEPSIFHGDVLSFIGEHSENDESLCEYYWMARIIGKQNAPDSIKLVLVPATAENQDSLYTAINKGSQDSLATWGTNLNFIGYEEGLRNKIAACKKGETFKHDFKQGQQQVYLVGKVVDLTANVAQSKVAVYAEKISPSTKTRREEYGRLNAFISDYTTIKAMQDSALSNGFHMMNATVASNSYNINQVRECRQAVRFAFEGSKGDISEIFDEANYLLVVGINGDIEEGYLSLNNQQIVDYIRMQLLPEKKAAYIVNNELANVTNKTIEGYAEALGTTPQEVTRVNFNMNTLSGLSGEVKVIAEAVKNAEGTVVGPIQGSNNVVVLQVGNKTKKDLEFNETDYKNKVSARAYSSAYYMATQYLTNQAEVKDNRIKFY